MSCFLVVRLKEIVWYLNPGMDGRVCMSVDLFDMNCG